VECGQEPASTYRLLLDMLRGSRNQDPEVRGTEAQHITNSLQRELSGQQCLIWLDNVQDKEILTAFRGTAFRGALLVTAVRKDIWEGLQERRKVHINHNIFWAAADDNGVDKGDKIASSILAVRAANDKSMTEFPPGCEVGHICRHCASRFGHIWL
jgi:hypothetical protein